MKQKTALYFVLTITFAFGCSSEKQSNENLPCLDITKNYPEKEIILTDIADVTYLHLNTKDDDYIFKALPYIGSIYCTTKNTIVVQDIYSGSVLFFSRDGDPISRFNRKGQGPEEYIVFANNIFYDEATDDVYIFSLSSNIIQVYSSKGEHRRKLTLPEGVNIIKMNSFDDQSLLVYDDRQSSNILKSKNGEITASVDSTFILISKANGEILDYIIVPNNATDLSVVMGDGKTKAAMIFARMTKCRGGLILFNPETDTVFFCDKNRTLTPVMHKTPLVNDLDPQVVFEFFTDIGLYQYMSTFTNIKNDYFNYYMRDKKTGEIFRPKITLPDYRGKEFLLRPSIDKYQENEYFFELDLIELKEAYTENKLSGQLKEFVETLDEDEDNNVFVLARFK